LPNAGAGPGSDPNCGFVVRLVRHGLSRHCNDGHSVVQIDIVR